MKYGSIVMAIVLLIGLGPTARAQTVSVFDTVYTPAGDVGGARVGTMFVPANSNGIGVVVVHGGGVGRATNRPWCDTLAARGYVVLTIDYADGSTIYPQAARAVKLAIEFMRGGAAQFEISTGRIVGLGFSDGARYIGETLPWDYDDVSFQTDPQVNDHLDAAILLYGDYSVDPIAPSARSCIRNVVQISTPVLLMHGTGDTDTPWTQSQEFYDSLLVHQKACQLRLFSGGQHGFELNWPSTTAFTVSGLIAKDTALSFLHRVLNPATAVSESPAPRVVSFFLEQNYPNPFNPSTFFRYTVPQRSRVVLSVFNTLGQLVTTLMNEEEQAGYHEVKFDGSGLSSGVYFYRIEAGSFVETRKLILLR